MITIERLKQLLHYDPETGHWRWLVNRAGTAKAGSVAGKQNNNGYRRLCVDGRAYLSARLAWFYMTGEWPSSCVDHIDHQRDNDAWVNLRMATVSQNMHNRSMNRNNTSGVKGVCWHKRQGKWFAQIMRAGKTYNLGLFDNIEDAKVAVETARASLHKEFACSGGKNDQAAR